VNLHRRDVLEIVSGIGVDRQLAERPPVQTQDEFSCRTPRDYCSPATYESKVPNFNGSLLIYSRAGKLYIMAEPELVIATNALLPAVILFYQQRST
jgi:hypothetical protein